MYRTYIQRIEIALLSYSLVHTDNTKQTVECKNTDKYKSIYIHKNATITNIQIRTCRKKSKTLNKENKWGSVME